MADRPRARYDGRVFLGRRAMAGGRIIGLWLVLAALPAAAFERAPLPSEAPMEPCPSQGAGFARIPGTETCLRVSGRVAAGLDVGGARMAAPVRGRISIDARGQSDLGPVRSFLRVEAGHR